MGLKKSIFLFLALIVILSVGFVSLVSGYECDTYPTGGSCTGDSTCTIDCSSGSVSGSCSYSCNNPYGIYSGSCDASCPSTSCSGSNPDGSDCIRTCAGDDTEGEYSGCYCSDAGYWTGCSCSADPCPAGDTTPPDLYSTCGGVANPYGSACSKQCTLGTVNWFSWGTKESCTCSGGNFWNQVWTCSCNAPDCPTTTPSTTGTCNSWANIGGWYYEQCECPGKTRACLCSLSTSEPVTYYGTQCGPCTGTCTHAACPPSVSCSGGVETTTKADCTRTTKNCLCKTDGTGCCIENCANKKADTACGVDAGTSCGTPCGDGTHCEFGTCTSGICQDCSQVCSGKCGSVAGCSCGSCPTGFYCDVTGHCSEGIFVSSACEQACAGYECDNPFSITGCSCPPGCTAAEGCEGGHCYTVITPTPPTTIITGPDPCGDACAGLICGSPFPGCSCPPGCNPLTETCWGGVQCVPNNIILPPPEPCEEACTGRVCGTPFPGCVCPPGCVPGYECSSDGQCELVGVIPPLTEPCEEACIGKECGSPFPGCDCPPGCTSDEPTCISGICYPCSETCATEGYDCGTWTFCGKSESCGPCSGTERQGGATRTKSCTDGVCDWGSWSNDNSCISDSDCAPGEKCINNVCTACALTSVSWVDAYQNPITSARENEPVYLKVVGNAVCNEQSVLFVIKEHDSASWWEFRIDRTHDPVETNPASESFVDGVAIGIWLEAEWQEDTSSGQTNPPEYFFTATVEGTTISKDNPVLLTVTKCGDGVIGGGEACDGTDAGTCTHGCNTNTCTCATEYCGDGTVQTPNQLGINELCDNGALNGVDVCATDCLGWIPKATWTDLSDNEITTATAVIGENEKLNMKLEYSGLADGTEVYFEVWEDLLVDNFVIKIEGATVDASGAKVERWTMTETDLNDVGLGDSDVHFSVFKKSDGSQLEQSDNLKLTVEDSTYCDTITTCGDYDETHCTDPDDCSVADATINAMGIEGVTCGQNGIDCFCEWDGDSCEGGYDSVEPGYVCGDGIIDPGEACDGTNWGPITGCGNFNTFTAGAGTLACNAKDTTYECQFNTSLCLGGTTGICGDGKIDTGETCDGTIWGPITGCSNFNTFTGGVLACSSSSCLFDTNDCTRSVTCGDGIIDSGEQCETNADIPAGLTCSDFDLFTGGTLSCTNCMISTSACTGGNGVGECGNGVVNIGEQCEGNPLTIKDDIPTELSCTSFDKFKTGILDCNEATCMIDTSDCERGAKRKIGTCHINQSIVKECDETPNVGFKSINWTGLWTLGTGPSGTLAELRCKAGGAKTIQCPAQVQLPFFGTYGIIASVSVIALIYAVWILRKKKMHS